MAHTYTQSLAALRLASHIGGARNSFESAQNMCPKMFSTLHGGFTKSRQIIHTYIYTYINIGANVYMQTFLFDEDSLYIL